MATGAEAVEYLRKHGVPDIIDDAVRELIARRAGDPIEFFLNHFQDLINQRAALFTKGAEVEVVGMSIDKSLNGTKGRVLGKQDEVMVAFGAPIGLRAIKTTNLRPLSGCVAAVGDEVEVVNMTLSKDLNGQKGRVKAFATKVFVKLTLKGGAEEMRALPQANLKVIQADDSAAVASGALEKGAEVEVQNMVIDTSMNGKRGTVKYRQDTVVVRIDEVGIKNLGSDNVRPAAEGGKVETGADVIIQKMVLDKSLNDKKAVVKQVTSKVYVQIADVGVKAFPVAALKRV
eukprot:TRINITY_DN55897_c0_g1_i1.p1 TRINITY_DN55897_c0_g1~~TRINITY_DN55897_c0_g1_i1.p1  ORF type:complete len:316 (+),score=105.35 TRINITY_DN55897_c0_g1_i1:86-949(+)